MLENAQRKLKLIEKNSIFKKKRDIVKILQLIDGMDTSWYQLNEHDKLLV